MTSHSDSKTSPEMEKECPEKKERTIIQQADKVIFRLQSYYFFCKKLQKQIFQSVVH